MRVRFLCASISASLVLSLLLFTRVCLSAPLYFYSALSPSLHLSTSSEPPFAVVVGKMPAPLRRAEPLVSASGLPSPALGPRTPTSEDGPYTLLRTFPRRHRSIKDRVGSRLKKLLARAKSFTVPEGRHHSHSTETERPRPHEYEDLRVRDFGAAQDGVAGGSLGQGRPHRRTMSDTSHFMSSVRRRLSFTLGNNTAATSAPTPDTSCSELAENPSGTSTPPPQLIVPTEDPSDSNSNSGKAAGLGTSKPPATPSPLRRPLTLAPTRSHASSTPRVEEEDESAMRAYDHDSSSHTHGTDADHSNMLLDSPAAYRAGEDNGPYIPLAVERVESNEGGASLFMEDLATSSNGTCDITPSSHKIELPDDAVPAPAPTPANPVHSTIAQTSPKRLQPPHTQPHTTTPPLHVPPTPTTTESNSTANLAGGANSGPTYVNPSMDANCVGLDETELEPKIPSLLVHGTRMLKVTSKKVSTFSWF